MSQSLECPSVGLIIQHLILEGEGKKHLVNIERELGKFSVNLEGVLIESANLDNDDDLVCKEQTHERIGCDESHSTHDEIQFIK